MATSVFRKGSAEARTAKAFLHDLTYTAGLRSTNQRTNGSGQLGVNVNAAEAVCKEVINRTFNDIDADLSRMSGVSFVDSLTSSRTNYVSYSSMDIAKALVYLAECLNVYWDDINATVHEKETFKKTILGALVEQYGRFTSMVSTSTTAATIPGARRASRATSTRTPGQAPKNSYKSSGPQSGNVRDLIGKPGNKLMAQGNYVYRIIGDHSKSNNTPTAFVRPLNASGAAGSTNAVFVNSGNGYTDCVCWFDDLAEAQAFLNAVTSKVSIKPEITNLHIVKNKPDSNGYYLVGTECGQCAISAKKLNEALLEQANLEEEVDPNYTCWDKAYEGKSKETLEELHYYMRKG